MAASAAALKGAEFPAERLRRAWDQLLWAQHHDAWITATTRSGRQAWAFQVAAETMEVEEIAHAVIGAAAETLSRAEARPVATPIGAQWFRVFNTTAAERREVVKVSWASDVGTRRARVFDGAGKRAAVPVPSAAQVYTARADGRRVRSAACRSRLVPGLTVVRAR